MEVAEGNRMIAEFMEIPPCEKCEDCGQYRFGPGIYYSPTTMQYNSDWNWLMPVVHKICKMIHDGPSREEWLQEERIAKKISTSYISNSIEMVWGATIDFIHWHNQQLKT